MQGCVRTQLCAPSRAALGHTPRGPRCLLVCSSSKKKQSGSSKGQKKKKVLPPSNPLLARLVDGPLIMGDAVMIAATEFSSERILWNEDIPYLAGVLVLSWFLAAVALGDYRGRAPSSENLYVQIVLGPVFITVLDTTVTWAIAAILAIGAYSLLIDQQVIDPAPLIDGLGTDDLSAQLEVAVASLIIMPCWRGIVAKLRG